MTQNIRFAPVIPAVSGVALAVLTFSLLAMLAYPLELVLGERLSTSVPRTTGLLLLGVIPVTFLLYSRFVAPTALLCIGFIGSVIADVNAGGPMAVRLGDEILVLNTSYLAAFIEGWYAWVLIIVLCAVVEHTVRVRWAWDPPNPTFDSTRVIHSRTSALAVAFAIGVVHTAVFIALAVEQGEISQLEAISVVAAIGGLLLGAVPIYLSTQKSLVGPTLVLGVLVAGTGIEAVVFSVGTPASSYLAFWWVYFSSILIVGLIEYLGMTIVSKVQ